MKPPKIVVVTDFETSSNEHGNAIAEVTKIYLLEFWKRLLPCVIGFVVLWQAACPRTNIIIPR